MVEGCGVGHRRGAPVTTLRVANQVTRLAHTEARTGGVDASTMARVVSGIDQTRATIAALDGRLEEMSRR